MHHEHMLLYTYIKSKKVIHSHEMCKKRQNDSYTGYYQMVRLDSRL